jgi:hypothetical protein
MHGGLEDGKPNKGPKGIISLQGDMGSVQSDGKGGYTGTGGGGDGPELPPAVKAAVAQGKPTSVVTKKDEKRARDEVKKFLKSKGIKTGGGNIFDIFNPLSKKRRKLSYNASMLIPGQKKRSAKYQKAYRDYLISMGVTPPDTLTGEEDDLAEFFVENAFDKPVAADAMLQTPQTYGEFIAENFGAPGVMMSGNVGGLEKFVKEDGTFGYTDVGNRDGADNILLPQTIAQAPSIIEEEEPEYVNPLSLLSPRIAGSQFAAEGGRIGLFKGAQADASAGKGAMSPGTDTGGGFRGGNGDGPKGPPTNIGGGGSKPKPGLGRVNNPNRFGPKNLSFFDKIKTHSTNNAKLEQAYKDGLISSDEYNVLGGYDVKQTLGFGPVKTAAASTAYNLVQSALGPKFSRGNQPLFDGAADVGRNTFGSTLKPDSALAQTYDTIMNTYKRGGRAGLAGGGIASLEDMDREGFLLGGIAKGLKKAVRGVKKLAKSPIGKAALGFAAFQYGGGLSGIMDKFNSLSKLQKFGVGIGVPSILAGLITPKEDEDKFDIDSYYASSQLDPSQSIRGTGSEFDFYGGQRIASAEGGATDKEPVAKKVMPLIDMDGKEKDYRETGGFVDMGRMEKADDVPARLSKNEFVFTADAVRNAGDGSVDKGSEVMYNMMKNLESGGDVSEESQGLDGARKMFQTSQRLEEVL